MVVKINATDCLSDTESRDLTGRYLDDNSYETLITEDCDYYYQGRLLFKFRKKMVPEPLLKVAWTNCASLAKKGRGRGAAAGYIDKDSVYWSKRDISWSNKWSAKYMVDDGNGSKKESKMKVNNEVASTPIGFYGAKRGLGGDYPCRMSHYTKTNLDKYHKAIPFFQHLSQVYQNLVPDKFNEQMDRAEINDFHIDKTPYSTITINRNFRTGVHKDSGDFGGWATLSVLEENKYHGGYFVLPQYKVAIDMRHGDILVCNVHEYHGNTELYETEEDKLFNDTAKQSFKDNLEVGVLGLNNRFSRLSFVCYLREDIIHCPIGGNLPI